jgi:hypothetical protein
MELRHSKHCKACAAVEREGHAIRGPAL